MVEEKLRNADSLLKNAAGNKQQYGFALMAYHGAIEDFFRQELAAEIAELESGLSGRKSGWLDLIKLWEQKHILAYEDKKKILNQNSKRQIVSHGGYFEVERLEAEAYGNFVKYFIEQNSSSRRSYRVTPTPEPRPVRPTAVANPPAPLARNTSCLKRFVVVLAIIILLIAGFFWTVLNVLNNIETLDGKSGLEAFQEQVMDSEPAEETPVAPDEDNKIPSPASAFPGFANEDDEPIVQETAVPKSAVQIRVVGNSYVRSGPETDSEVIGTVLDAEKYEIIEISPDGDWYKIELAIGQEGWLGSTRAIQISP